VTERPVGGTGTLWVSLLAGLTTWVTLLAWTGFAEQPFGYLGPIAGYCLLVAVLGTLLRMTRLPAVGVLMVQALVVASWLQHSYGGVGGVSGLLPTPDSLRATVDTVAQASLAAQSFAAPVPASAPQFYPLLVVAGAATVLMVDFLAVGLRRAPLAGLPLLAAYTAPVSILDGGVSWVSFAAAALCFVSLIAAVEGGRLTHWGRQLTPGTGLFDLGTAPVAAGGVWSSARKIGLTATAMAVVVPVLVPTFTATLFDGGSGGGSGSGDAVSISNPMVDLKRDLTRGADLDLVTVTTQDPAPSYLRLTVLNAFDGNAWRPADRDIPIEQRAEGAIPRPSGLEADVPVREYASTVTAADGFRSKWLPTPYPAVSVVAPGDWRYDRSTMDFISATDDESVAGLNYRVRSLEVAPTAAQLADAPLAPLAVAESGTDLPRDFPTFVSDLAKKETAGRRSQFEKAVALQQFFRANGGFTYDLQTSAGNGTDDLVRFLSTGPEGRVGYCEQFAAAMAVMGRSLGIPSRVAVGFLRPEAQGDDYVYSAHDLHAWPEMYFGGVGWIRFEPTPQARTGGVVPGYTTQQVPQAAPSDTASSVPSAAPTVNPVDRSAEQQATEEAAGAGSSAGRTVLLCVLGVLLLGATLLAPRALRSLVRRRRWSAADDARSWVEAGWQEIADTARDLGIGWDGQVTLRRTAAVLEDSFGDSAHPEAGSARPPHGSDLNPVATQALHRMVGLLERARYARTLPAGAATAESVDADVDACVAAMRAGAGRRRVQRAQWLPRSLTPASLVRRPRSARTVRRLGGPGVDQAV
jgi:transglutaminase-like putative cysteine protease